MKRKIWRYTMSYQEEVLWNQENMQGWRKAFEACVEDEARDKGCKKYVIYDSNEVILSRGEVSVLVSPPS
ncbi:MAG: hypothetical protein ACLFTT_11705 [Candidatus Hydrogenedentota bacterium]